MTKKEFTNFCTTFMVQANFSGKEKTFFLTMPKVKPAARILQTERVMTKTAFQKLLKPYGKLRWKIEYN